MTDKLKLAIFKKESNKRPELEGNIQLHNYNLTLKRTQTNFLQPITSLLNLPAISTTFSTESMLLLIGSHKEDNENVCISVICVYI